ncbi:hypothetical protein CLIB1444_10S04918 [[Candida] jaroonii]|uniref:Uncharacterized protein n=1 Tax=[Candida] jaroonii TaxID=467808 RepID=A0ACA9YD03_9ASCO|nr:hypothetical protein CLIB1444_10S04918 [[Candida] jaroonii]
MRTDEFLLLTLLHLVMLYLINWTTFVDLHISTTQGLLVLTAVVAQGSPVYLNIWRRCRDHFKGGNPFDDQCFEMITSEIAKLSLTLAGLGYITGWYKRDNSVSNRQSVCTSVTYILLLSSTILSTLMLLKISMKWSPIKQA